MDLVAAMIGIVMDVCGLSSFRLEPVCGIVQAKNEKGARHASKR
jgi:hypothetical protein